MPDQRLHNVNILVACAGPAKGDVLETRYGPMVSRAGTTLKHTMSDVELMDQYWSSCASSDGDITNLVLENPTIDDLRATIDHANFLLKVYPTSKSGIDFYFAGHGTTNGKLVLRDGYLGADDFLGMLSSYSSTDGGRLGFGFMLDCCFSGGFLFKTIEYLEEDNHRRRQKLRMYDAFVSSMYDEVSRESDMLGHGIFTFASAIQTISGINNKRLLELVAGVPDQTGLRSLLVQDISAMDFGPFAPAGTRLTTYLSLGTQNPIDCVNGHTLITESRGEVSLVDIEETIDSRVLADAFTS